MPCVQLFSILHSSFFFFLSTFAPEFGVFYTLYNGKDKKSYRKSPQASSGDIVYQYHYGAGFAWSGGVLRIYSPQSLLLREGEPHRDGDAERQYNQQTNCKNAQRMEEKTIHQQDNIHKQGACEKGVGKCDGQ